MLPEYPSAARISEYVCDLEYLFSRMNVGSYGAGMLLTFHLQHTATAEIAVRGMTRSLLVIDRSAVEQGVVYLHQV